VRRRLAAAVLAGVVAAGLVGLAGCGDRDPAAPAGAATGTGAPAASDAASDGATSAEAAGDVETAVRDAEDLLASIDAELAADAGETD
jgi:hypothetical protein